MSTIVLKVSMHCNACRKKVTKVLEKIEGVDQVDIDGNGYVTVSGNVDPAILLKSLKKAGRRAELVSVEDGNNQNQNNEDDEEADDNQNQGGGGDGGNMPNSPMMAGEGSGVGNTPTAYGHEMPEYENVGFEPTPYVPKRYMDQYTNILSEDNANACSIM